MAENIDDILNQIDSDNELAKLLGIPDINDDQSIYKNTRNPIGRRILDETPIEMITPGFIEAFYIDNDTRVNKYPDYSIAMIDSSEMTQDRLYAFKKYDMAGLAHLHYDKISPDEIAHGVGLNSRVMNTILKGVEKGSESYAHLVIAARVLLSHKSIKTDYDVIKSAVKMDDYKSHSGLCKSMIEAMGLERSVRASKTPVQREYLGKIFGVGGVLSQGRSGVREKRAAIMNELGM